MKTMLIAILIIAFAIGCIWYRARLGTRQQTALKQAHGRDVAELTRPLFRPAISVIKSNEATRSYVGGAPPASPALSWPTRKGHAFSFIACIDCSELPRTDELDWLPRTGLLLFFYDMQDQPWGFDPKDRGGSATIYLPASGTIDSQTALPPSELPAEATIPKRFLKFAITMLPPSWETPQLAALGLSEQEMDVFMDQRSELYGDQPHHQIGGYPDPIQNPEMDEECQLVTNGLYCGDATGYNDPRATELRKEADGWSLLFQVDSDDELKIMWGDAGMIYFWIRRDDARSLKFDNTWVILQCG